MSEKEQVIREKVEHSGIFNFKGLYSFAHDWLIEEKYGVVEEKYSEKVSGEKKDINFVWAVSKSLSDYFKIDSKIEFTISGLTDVEVEIDSHRKSMNKGKVNIEIKSSLIKDPDSKWDSSPLFRFLRDVYNKYVIPGRIESTKNIIKKGVQSFKEELKAYLELTGKR